MKQRMKNAKGKTGGEKKSYPKARKITLKSFSSFFSLSHSHVFLVAVFFFATRKLLKKSYSLET